MAGARLTEDGWGLMGGAGASGAGAATAGAWCAANASGACAGDGGPERASGADARDALREWASLAWAPKGGSLVATPMGGSVMEPRSFFLELRISCIDTFLKLCGVDEAEEDRLCGDSVSDFLVSGSSEDILTACRRGGAGEAGPGLQQQGAVVLWGARGWGVNTLLGQRWRR